MVQSNKFVGEVTTNFRLNFRYIFRRGWKKQIEFAWKNRAQFVAYGLHVKLITMRSAISKFRV
jgi:hypothetical protein